MHQNLDIRKVISLGILFAFLANSVVLPSAYAQRFEIGQLPEPGKMVGVSLPFAPLVLKGIVVNPQKPLEFQFIVDTGRGPQDTATVKEQANQLVKYFLAGLTIPEGDLWVNLSPYEKNRMVPEALGQTDLGRDLLAQDYILKQLTASLIYPGKDLGKEFWSRVYARAQQQFGTTNVPVDTFNKVWILPDEAQVYENVNAAYVTKSTLKVMLDEDYLAKQKRQATKAVSISSQIVREIVIPEITKEVNTGKNFAPLRQIYQALILAKWYKATIQNGLLDAVYINKNKVVGVNLNDPTVKEQIYERYLKAYKKGAFNYIKEDPTPDGQVVPRKYFSGGLIWKMNVRRDGAMSAVKSDGAMEALKIDLEKSKDNAMAERLPENLNLLRQEIAEKLDDGKMSIQTADGQVIEDGYADVFDKAKEKLGPLSQEAFNYLNGISLDEFKSIIRFSRVAANLQKNAKKGFGLTIIAGMPFGEDNAHFREFEKKVEEIRESIRQITHGNVAFNQPQGVSALHLTIQAITRTRNYNEGDPTSIHDAIEAVKKGVSEIDDKVKNAGGSGLAESITNIIARSAPPKVKLTDLVYYFRDGELSFTLEPVSEFNEKLVDGKPVKILRIKDQLKSIPSESKGESLHISLGRVTAALTDEQIAKINNLFKELKIADMAPIQVNDLKVVLYRHRSLNEIEAVQSLKIGSKQVLNFDALFNPAMINPIPVVLLVGKPGSGKSYLGKEVTKMLGPTVVHISLGQFARDHGYNTPLVHEIRVKVYKLLIEYLRTIPNISLLIFDNNPYGDSSYEDTQEFLSQPEYKLVKVVEINVNDEVALKRQLLRERKDQKSPEFRLNYYKSDSRRNVPTQIAKFTKLGIVQIVDNNEDRGKESIVLISNILNPIALDGARNLVRRIVPHIQDNLGLAADQFIVNMLAEEIMKKDFSNFKKEIQERVASVYSGDSDEDLLMIEACLIFIDHLVDRLETRFKGQKLLVDRIALANELRQEGLFNFAYKKEIKGTSFTDLRSSSLNILRQEAKIFINAEPTLGDLTKYHEASPQWNENAARTMRESRERFAITPISDAAREYWKNIDDLKGEVQVIGSPAGEVKTSVVILVLADRISALPARLQELADTMEKGTFEVNIVLADPNNTLKPEDKDQVVEKIEKLGFPAKIIVSKNPRSISTNRNLGSSESKGKYIVFLDDDVQLSKRTIPLMIESLENHPEIGAAQAVTYDGESGELDRPKIWFSKKVFSPTVMLTNIAVGMVVATRAEIVKAVPFVPFWPNFGEDVFFGTQIKDLGFYLSFIYDQNAFIIHQHVMQESATRSVNTIKNSYIHHALSYYFSPQYYSDLGQIEIAVRINKTNPGMYRSMEEFFVALRNRVKEFLDSENAQFSQEAVEELGEMVKKNNIPEDTLSQVLEFFVLNKEAIVSFKHDWLAARDLKSEYVLDIDSKVNVTFPERNLNFGEARGFSDQVNSFQDAQRVLYRVLNGMRNNAGPKVRIQARGMARAYLEMSDALADIPKNRLEQYYGSGSFSLIIDGDDDSILSKDQDQQFDKTPLTTDLSGILLGIDIGGSSIKRIALVDGAVHILEKSIWDSYSKTTADDHVNFINKSVMDAIEQLAKKLGKTPDEVRQQIRGIGISWNTFVKGDQILSHYDKLNADETEKMKGALNILKMRFQHEINSNIRVTLKNDGMAGAIGGAFASREETGLGNIAYLGLGTGLAFGIVDHFGRPFSGLFQIHRMKVDDWTGSIDEMGRRLSVDFFEGKISRNIEGKSKDQIKNFLSQDAREIIDSVNRGEPKYEQVAKEMGKSLAEGIYSLKRYWPINEIYIGGGLVTGEFGKILLLEATVALALKGERIKLLQVQGAYQGYESAIGAAYDVAVQRAIADKAMFVKWKKVPRDQAMLQIPQAVSKSNQSPENGGIDLNQINVNREGKAVVVQFDPAQLDQLMQGGFEGFTPVIINITPIQSPLPLLGVGPAREEEIVSNPVI